MTPKRWFWLAVVAQVLVLFVMIGTHQYTLSTGRTVRLKTEPVDPWDPFRGQYVTLNYTISQFKEGAIPMEGMPYKRGQTIWITLRAGDPYWNAVAVSDRRPSAGGTDVALRGKVEWIYDDWSEPNEAPKKKLVRVRYGIEQFYVPEGEGPGLENRQVQLTVEAKVDSFGRAALYKVFKDDKEVRWR